MNIKMNLKTFFSDNIVVRLGKNTFSNWSDDGAPSMAAALSYYTVFSMAPLCVIAIGIAGLLFSKDAAQGQLFSQIRGLVGDQGAQAIQGLLTTQTVQNSSALATIIGFIIVLIGATGVFSELQTSLNKIWKVKPEKISGVKAFLKNRLLTFAMVLSVGFLLMVSLLASAILAGVEKYLQGLLPGGAGVWQVANFGLSFLVITFLFGLIFKVLPDAEIKWKEVWLGALITALLFTIGKTLIGLYLGKSGVATTFGAAGSLVIVLSWVYYSSQILFVGAEFTKAHSEIRDIKTVQKNKAAPKVMLNPTLTGHLSKG